MDTTWQDLRYGVRGLGRNPGFAITAILSLALGIGASLAIFTVADNLLLRPLPYRDAQRLVLVWEVSRQRPERDENVVSPANYLDWKKQNDVFEAMAGFTPSRSVVSDGTRAEELEKQLVSAEFLPLLGVEPARGRLFTAEEERRAVHDDTQVLISYRLWQSWFGGEESVIGRKIQVNSMPRTIIGVLPRGFYFMSRDTDVWQPLGLDEARDYHQQGRWMLCLAKLKAGVTRAEAQARMGALAARLEADYPALDANWTVNVEPLRDSLVRWVRTSLLMLLGAVGLLLAVACANVANLLVARHASRRTEMAVRVSLGAGRGRVIRQLLTESVLLGVAGGLAGLVVARWAVSGLLAMAPKDLTRGTAIAVDARIVALALAVSVLTGIVFGLAPALVSSRAGLIGGLRAAGRSAIGQGGRLRSFLVGAEVTVSVVLLVGATLLFRSLVRLEAVNPGLNPSNVLTFSVMLPAVRYPEAERRTQFFERVLEGIRQLPGVRSAGAVSFLDFTGLVAGTGVRIEGQPAARPGEGLSANVRTLMPGYFGTLGIPIERGRDFTAADNDPKTPYRFLVNRAFVRAYLKGEEPLGKRISVEMDDRNPYGEIIGVAGDVYDGALDHPARPTVYYIHAHLNYTRMTFVVRTAGSPLRLAEAASRTVRGLDSAQPVAEVEAMERVVEATFARQRFSAFLLTGFSLTALLLAGIGIYGVLAYAVTERTREIGVRVALGAQPSRIVSLIVLAGARVVLAGAVAGIAGALALSGLMKGLLFGIGPRDAATYVAAPAVLLAVALAAAWLPARKAARLEPMEALRAE